MNNNVKIFLVDDDALFLKSLEIDFKTDSHFEVSTFPTGEQCISHLSEQPDIIILDYHLDGIDPNAINGIATLDNIKALNPDIPVVMLSSQDKIEVAIAKGKKLYDKREALAERDSEREIARAMRDH